MNDLVKQLAGADGVNLALLLAVVALAGAVAFLWRQGNADRERERQERQKANEQHLLALNALGEIVRRVGDIVSDLRVTIAACTWRGKDR